MNVDPAIGGLVDIATVDEAIAAVAARQHGIVGRAQLLQLGIGRRALEHRLDRGRLHGVHRGVYAVGHPALTLKGRWMAAVLAGGPDAALSHRPAGALWAMRHGWSGVIDVTVRLRRRAPDGVRFRLSELPEDEVTEEDGIPVTIVPRTLYDLASVLDRPALERAIDQAEVLRLHHPLSLVDMLERHPHRPGAATIRAILESGRIGAGVTRSDFEQAFKRFLTGRDLPLPEINAVLEVNARHFEVDCLWRDQRVIVELDGHETHGTRAAFERDRARDRRLRAAGWTVVRLTWRQFATDKPAIEADLRAILGLSGTLTTL
jgi:very-short-patch-repair endonuclease